MQTQTSEPGKEFVNSKDGTPICYSVCGRGPGLAVVHGAFRAGKHYQKLAEALSDSFTVYRIDRRGRMESGPRGDHYSLQKECEDVMAVLEKHSISYLFGHSYGGLIALNVALQLPLDKLAVYEPAIFGNGVTMPLEWLPRFEHELQKEDFVAASVTFIKGSRMGGMMGLLPRFVMKPMFRAMADGPDWDENAKLLLTVPEELRTAQKMEPDIDKYRKVTNPVLVMSGTKSPRFIREAAAVTEKILPGSQYLSLTGLNHSAPDNDAPEKIAEALKEFFR